MVKLFHHFMENIILKNQKESLDKAYQNISLIQSVQDQDITNLQFIFLNKLPKNMVGTFNTLRMVESSILVLVILLMHMTKRRMLCLSMMNLHIMKMLKTTYFEKKIWNDRMKSLNIFIVNIGDTMKKWKFFGKLLKCRRVGIGIHQTLRTFGSL